MKIGRAKDGRRKRTQPEGGDIYEMEFKISDDDEI